MGNNTFLNNFLAELRKRLESKELTQQKIADIAGVSQPKVQRWLSGENEPSVSEAEVVCKSLGILGRINWGGMERGETLEMREMVIPAQGESAEYWKKRFKEVDAELAYIRGVLRKLIEPKDMPKELSSELPSGVKAAIEKAAERLDREDQKS